MKLKYPRVLMLWPSKTDYWARTIENMKLLQVDAAYRNLGILGHAAKKLTAVYGHGFPHFLGAWSHDIKRYDVIIIQAAAITVHLPDWLRKHGFQGRIIYWYWDPVSGSVHPNRIAANTCDLFSFDENDAEKYGMQYRNTFFVTSRDEMEQQRREHKPKFDVFFIGRDKGRLKSIRELEKKLQCAGLRTNFYITATKPYYPSARYLDKPIDYSQVLGMLMDSKAILEINQKNQSGLSMRCMESLFFQKKLFTNNRAVRNMEFYRPENIYVLGDEQRDLQTFMQLRYQPVDRYLTRYRFDIWLDALLK